MLSKNLILAVLALANFATAVPASIDHRAIREGELTNAQRIARGLGIARPKRLFDSSRTVHAAPAKRSGSPEQPVSRVGFTTLPNQVTPVKRGLTTYYASVNNEKLIASTSNYDAESFIFPDFTQVDMGPLTWLSSYTDAEVVTGQQYTMYGIENNGLITLGFGTAPAGAITDFFVSPTYPGGLSARLINGGGSQDLIWVVDASCEFYLATSMSAAYAALGSAKALLPAAYAIGAEPDFTAALSASATALVNPARLWATDYTSSKTGYIQINSGDYNRFVLTAASTDATVFYAPGLTSSAESSGQNLVARIGDDTYTAVAAKSTVDVNDNLQYFTGKIGGDTSSLVFTIPANQAGFVTAVVNGDASNWVTSLTRYGSELAAAPKSLLPYMSQVVSSVCVEMVPLGAEPQYCTPYVQDLSYGQYPTGFYASTSDGGVAGYLSPQADGTFALGPSFTKLFIPSYSPYNSVQNVYAKIGTTYRRVSIPSIAGSSGAGPLATSTTSGTMFKVAANRSGRLGSPWISNDNVVYTYYYNSADSNIYAFPSDADATAYSADMREICIETLLENNSPSACATYWASKSG